MFLLNVVRPANKTIPWQALREFLGKKLVRNALANSQNGSHAYTMQSVIDGKLDYRFDLCECTLRQIPEPPEEPENFTVKLKIKENDLITTTKWDIGNQTATLEWLNLRAWTQREDKIIQEEGIASIGEDLQLRHFNSKDPETGEYTFRTSKREANLARAALQKHLKVLNEVPNSMGMIPRGYSENNSCRSVSRSFTE